MEDLIEIDVIILSYAQDLELRSITEACISSLVASEDIKEIRFNIIVMESEKGIAPFQYPGTKTVYPKAEFGYNSFMNIGIDMTAARYICICNNDLLFHSSWATEILKVFKKYPAFLSASPFCPNHHSKMGFELNNGIYPGYRNHFEIAGWCLFFKREMLQLTGKLDENYRFWCADNDYANTISALNIGHVLVSSSIVDHLGNQTVSRQSAEMQEELTSDEFFYFEKKWNYRRI